MKKDFIVKQLYRHPQWRKVTWPTAEAWEATGKRIDLITQKMDRLAPDERHAIDLFVSALNDKALDDALHDTEVTRKEWFENAPKGFFKYYSD